MSAPNNENMPPESCIHPLRRGTIDALGGQDLRLICMSFKESPLPSTAGQTGLKPNSPVNKDVGQIAWGSPVILKRRFRVAAFDAFKRWM